MRRVTRKKKKNGTTNNAKNSAKIGATNDKDEANNKNGTQDGATSEST